MIVGVSLFGANGVVGIFVFVGSRLTKDWVTIWTAMLVVVGVVTLAVFVAAAFFAWQQADITRENARVELTNEVLNSTWVNEALEALAAFTKDDYANSRVRLNDALTARMKAQAIEPEAALVLKKSIGTYTYLANLYKRGVLDDELMIEAAANTISLALWVMQDVLKRYVENGALEDSIFDLGRACVARFKKRPELLVFNPYMRDWNP